LPRLLEERGIDDAVLVGHSDGGSIALVAAALVAAALDAQNAQSCIRRLVLEAPERRRRLPRLK